MGEKEKIKVIERVQKLLALSRNKGASEAEAELAASMAREFMNKYDLTLSEVDIKKEEIQRDYVETGFRVPRFWMLSLSSIVAKGFDCRGLNYRGRVTFIGLPADVEITKYVFTYLLRTIQELQKNKTKEIWSLDELERIGKYGNDLRTYLKSYAMGIVDGVEGQIYKQRMAREAMFKKQAEEGGTGMELIVLKGAMVNKFVEKKYPRIGNTTFQGGIDGKGYYEGRDVGSNISINPAIK